MRTFKFKRSGFSKSCLMMGLPILVLCACNSSPRRRRTAKSVSSHRSASWKSRTFSTCQASNSIKRLNYTTASATDNSSNALSTKITQRQKSQLLPRAALTSNLSKTAKVKQFRTNTIFCQTRVLFSNYKKTKPTSFKNKV